LPVVHDAVAQFEHGARPVELQFVPLMHGSTHVLLAVLHA
jgi:hypothetical protein